MDLEIKGKVALVAAASRGLGRAVAERLAREGAQVAVCSRDEESILRVGNEIADETGGKIFAAACDVTDSRQVGDFVRKVRDELGPVAILVTNAGGPAAGPALDFDPDDYRAAIELNLMSTITLVHAILPDMRQLEWGRIVAVTSVAAKQPIGTLILSNTARAGVHGYLKTLSAQVAVEGITVNTVLPGYTLTERVENLARSYAATGKGDEDDFYSAVNADIPAARLGKPEEFANAVAFLVSEGAGYITGVSLPIDGGFTRGLF
ncbi:MAG: SDR family oxidoreductase [bacterium]|nr:SDR family oxidoreductase [bacterium]